MRLPVPSVQKVIAPRGIAIEEVGLCAIRCSIAGDNAEHGKRKTVTSTPLAAVITAERKRRCLSRFIEVLVTHGRTAGPSSVVWDLQVLHQRLGSPTAPIRRKSTYFLCRHALTRDGTLAAYDRPVFAENVSTLADLLRQAVHSRSETFSVGPADDESVHHQGDFAHPSWISSVGEDHPW